MATNEQLDRLEARLDSLHGDVREDLRLISGQLLALTERVARMEGRLNGGSKPAEPPGPDRGVLAALTGIATLVSTFVTTALLLVLEAVTSGKPPGGP